MVFFASEAELEQAIDRSVQRRLQTDRTYRHAADAEQQAEREAEITRQVERDLGWLKPTEEGSG